MQCLPKLLALLKIHVKGFKKILRLSIFVICANILRLYLVLTLFFPTKYPKIVTGSLNECGIV